MHLRDLTQFLSELKENNTRPWFIMNKPRYDILRVEFLDVLTELIKEIGRFDKQVVACDPKKAMFRFQRDTRFSHDKTPYKAPPQRRRRADLLLPHRSRRYAAVRCWRIPAAGGAVEGDPGARRQRCDRFRQNVEE
jgi:uncharacterized protein (DUF2461 family)